MMKTAASNVRHPLHDRLIAVCLGAALLAGVPVAAQADDPIELRGLRSPEPARGLTRSLGAETRELHTARLSSSQGSRPPHLASDDETEFALASAILDHDAALGDAAFKQMSRQMRGHEALVAAVAAGRLEMVRALLAHGASVDHRSRHPATIGHTPLTAAIWRDDLLAMRTLLRAGANPNRMAAMGSPLAYALQLQREASAIALIDAGASTARVSSQRNALFQAAYMGRTRVVAHLLDRGAALELRDARDRTILVEAFESKQAATVRLLLDRGADTSALGLDPNALRAALDTFPSQDGPRRR